MNVLLSAYACEPNRGTEEGFGWNWSTHLARAGHTVWVLTRTYARETIEQSLSADPIPNLHFVYVDIPARWNPLIKGLFGVYAHYFLWQRAAYRVAQKLDGEASIDVIHHVTWGSLIGGSWLWKIGRPFVFGPVGGGQVAPKAFREYFPTRWKQEATRTWITEHLLPHLRATKRMLKRTALLLATNSETLVAAQRMGAPRTSLFLDTGLPAHYFSSTAKRGYRDNTMHILWVGRLLERKAIRLSLQVVSKITFPFHMTILGDGPQGDDVRSWIEAFGLQDRVSWKGRVPWNEVQTSYEQHEIFLFTSLRDSFGSQLLEAMANGLAIVTLDHQGAHDFVPDDVGIKVPVGSVTETIERLAEALHDMYERPEQLRSMSAAGLAFARKHEWSLKAESMTTYYEQIVEENSTPVSS